MIFLQQMIAATAVCGMVYAALAGQPLTIIGSTGPVLAFIAVLYKTAARMVRDFRKKLTTSFCPRFTPPVSICAFASPFLYGCERSRYRVLAVVLLSVTCMKTLTNRYGIIKVLHHLNRAVNGGHKR